MIPGNTIEGTREAPGIRRLKLITTDITKAEVRRRIADNLRKEIASWQKWKRRARTLRTASRLQHIVPFVDLDATDLTRQLYDGFEAFLRTHNANLY